MLPVEHCPSSRRNMILSVLLAAAYALLSRPALSHPNHPATNLKVVKTIGSFSAALTTR